MAVIDLYSKRQKKLRGDIPDVYVYDNLPDTLKVQIVHIWFDSLGNENDFRNRDDVHNSYKLIVTTLYREYGWFSLSTPNSVNEFFFDDLRFFFSKNEILKKS